MLSDLFICPVCGEKLYTENGTYRCAAGHSFDIARKGYVNLFLGRAGGQHGDNREMIAARRDFLSAGHYKKLAEALTETALASLPQNPRILDAGCGECYYTAHLSEALQADGRNAEIVGIDISREALAYGARRSRNIALAVGSVYRLPFADATFDALLSVFSPYAGEEFLRVLKPGGLFLMAIPRERHLFGMKEILYEHPYENKPEDTALAGFSLLSDRRVAYTLHLNSQTDIHNLFCMTPYYYRTSEAGRKRLQECGELTTEIAFSVLLYKKI